MSCPEFPSPAAYLSRNYARSFDTLGRIDRLSGSGAWLLERSIPATGHFDVCGLYPLFCCQDWSQLPTDLESLGRDSQPVSLTVVTDPFGSYTPALLEECFPHLSRPYKQHFATQCNAAPDRLVSKHHRYYARRALETVSVDVCEPDDEFLDDWCALYQELVKKHGISGIQVFSKESFAHQLRTPGLVVLRATLDGRIVSAHLWYIQGSVAYSHLAASNAEGYRSGSSYALYWRAIEYFRDKVDYLDLGAAADRPASDGLTLFKKGWATTLRQTFLCGRIFDEETYRRLSQAHTTRKDFFPAYRDEG